MQHWRWLGYGVALAMLLQYTLHWASHLPVWQRLQQRFIWWRHGAPTDERPLQSSMGDRIWYCGTAQQARREEAMTGLMAAGTINNTTTAMVLYSDNNEAVEWLNMCWRKVCIMRWRIQTHRAACANHAMTASHAAGLARIPKRARKVDRWAAAARV